MTTHAPIVLYKVTAHGRTLIGGIDHLPGAKRYAEDSFKLTRPAGVVIRWEPREGGGLMLTWSPPHQATFRTSTYWIDEEVAS